VAHSVLIKAPSYALDRLSGTTVSGLPEFQEERQTVFARSDAKRIGTESYLQGSYKLDIILVKWRRFKKIHERNHVPYSDVCCKSGCDQP
jgi:hypothetical protein